jgi:hypothetical protein
MGINEIHILTNPDGDRHLRLEAQALAAYQEELAREHRNGEHPWGRMIRACPLCQTAS